MLSVLLTPQRPLKASEQRTRYCIYCHRSKLGFLKHPDVVFYCFIISGKQYQLILNLITLLNITGKYIVNCVFVRVQSETLADFLS